MAKKALLVVLVVVVGYGGWRWWSGGTGDRARGRAADGGGLVYDRLWIDHMPQSDKDTINLFVAVTEEPLGLFQATSAWRGNYEMFLHQGHGGELPVVFPQTGEHEKIRVRARSCHEQHMDYCLELRGSTRGVTRYYSRKGWEIDAQDPAQLAARADAIVQGLNPAPLH